MRWSRAETEPKSTTGRRCIEISLKGHLRRGDLAVTFHRATSEIHQHPGEVNLLIDCREMTDYDSDARSLFITWNSEHKRRIRRVAIITEKTLWHMVVGAMAIASSQQMKAFENEPLARAWLAQRET